MAETVYGFDESKSKVEVPDKATYDADISALESGKVDKTTQSAKDSEQDTSIATAQSTADGKQDPIMAGTGISIGSDGKTINHSNSITAKTSYVGSATAVPRFKFDAQGHITGVTTATIYPPTTPGEEGQFWKSDGAGAGAWADTEVSASVDDENNLTVTVNGVSVSVALPSGGKKLYTGTIGDLIAYSSSEVTVNKEFDIEYIYPTTNGSQTWYVVKRVTVSAGTYKGKNIYKLGIGCLTASMIGYIHVISNSIAVYLGTDLNAANGTCTQTTSATISDNYAHYRLYV